LIAAVGKILAEPKHAPADSFVLHAPLELLARAGLLPLVRPEDRDGALDQIRALGAKYEAAGEPVAPPAPITFDSVDDGVRALVGALDAGELDDVDRIATWVGERIDARQLQRALAQPIAASLAAAAHGSILLDLFPRIALAADVPVTIVRGPARELARHPDWRLHWFDDPDGVNAYDRELVDVLLDVPMLGPPGSNFIFPIMHQAEESGIAAKLLSSVTNRDHVDARAVGRDLARIAAWSMLQEPPDEAPYGWSHCLTMPQSVIALAGGASDPRTAVAVATTHVVGFRAALGQRELRPSFDPEMRVTTDIDTAIHLGREEASATAWHADDDELDGIVIALASHAAQHEDAHLVKYTLACFDAAVADPDHRRLYLAAAASLNAWWATV
jgi:hypothetical protein